MTGPAPLLDFFVLEAGEYLEQLDALLSGARDTVGPDAAALQRLARALRGSATMAKLGAFADVASGLERLGRGLQAGTISWDPEVRAVGIAAVDDLKLLVRSARTWTDTDTERARARAAELRRYAPSTASSVPTPVMTGGLSFFAAEATNIAAGVELLRTRPDDRDAANQVLKRVRAFRGVAGIADISGLADVLDAIEEAMRSLERGTGPVSPAGNAVLGSALILLRRIAIESRESKPADLRAPERLAFADAVERWFEQEVDAPVVPIADLFYGDGGPHVVATAPNPPTSSAERFRLELVSSGEHLRGLLLAAQAGATDAPDRTRREVRRALRSVANVARSFGDQESAEWFDATAASLTTGQPLDLAKLHGIADILTDAGRPTEPLIVRLRSEPTSAERAAMPRVTEPRRMDEIAPHAIDEPVAEGPFQSQMAEPPGPPIGEPLPPAIEEPTRPRMEDPLRRMDEALHQEALRPHMDEAQSDSLQQLDAGIAAIARLDTYPLAAPVPIPDAEIVAIESLLYRGRGALTRAIEVRDDLRRAGGTAPPEALAELFDLLDLAVAE